MATNPNNEEQRFRELVETVRALRPGAAFLLTAEELRLICHRQFEFWAAVEGRKVRKSTPEDSKGPNVYI
jgi:hypothetical protein